MLSFRTSGSFNKTETFLKKMSKGDIFRVLERFGREGVAALRSATPSESGATAAMWSYEVTKTRDSFAINFTNSHLVGGTPLVILLQFGHGTGTGGYVRGRDFINPAVRPVFDKMAAEAWKAVTSA